MADRSTVTWVMSEAVACNLSWLLLHLQQSWIWYSLFAYCVNWWCNRAYASRFCPSIHQFLDVDGRPPIRDTKRGLSYITFAISIYSVHDCHGPSSSAVHHVVLSRSRHPSRCRYQAICLSHLVRLIWSKTLEISWYHLSLLLLLWRPSNTIVKVFPSESMCRHMPSSLPWFFRSHWVCFSRLGFKTGRTSGRQNDTVPYFHPSLRAGGLLGWICF